MATTLKNTVIKNCGTVPVLIYETQPGNRVTVLGISFTNLTDKFVYVDVLVEDDTSVSGYYLKDSILPAGTSLRAVSTGEKLVLAPSNRLLVRSSLDDSVDVIVSYVEIT
jgi:hypothetical protein|tara:strand:+ start:801 stop:1130 length:330 start_codon:yes stop_codon:yes gene_type:complete